LHRQRSRLDRHVSAVFEQLAREHAVHLIAGGRLPADTVVGRWWRDEVVEVDVLGLSGDRPVLVGEAKWQDGPVAQRDVQALRRKCAYLPDAGTDPRLTLWARNGPTPGTSPSDTDLWVFTPADMF
jgi:uncharacterized protein